MKEKRNKEEIVVLDKPLPLEQVTLESSYLNCLVSTESTVLQYLQLPQLKLKETRAKGVLPKD